MCGKEVKEKDKIECLTAFAPHDLVAKTEYTEDLEKNWHKQWKRQSQRKWTILKRDMTMQQQLKESQG